MTTAAIESRFGELQTPLTVTSEGWGQYHFQPDWQQVVARDATGKKIVAYVDFSAGSTFDAQLLNARLYVDGAGYLDPPNWVWGKDWEGTYLWSMLNS